MWWVGCFGFVFSLEHLQKDSVFLSLLQQNTWEEMLGPSTVFWCYFQTNDFRYNSKLFCVPAALALYKSKNENQIKKHC